jgi:arylsulfatase A-like enzyme
LEFTSHGYDGHLFDAQMQAVKFPEGRYRVDAQTDFALEYLRSRDRNRPVFLFISYIEPHHQNDHRHYEGPHGSKERWKDYQVPGDLVDTKGDWRAEYPDYLGCINSLDANLGRLRGELEKLGMAQNTLIIYTSDHACHFRTRNSEYKRACQDNAIRVPMVAYGPGFRGGKVIEELVSLIDIPPTILAAGQIEPPDYMMGRPMQGLVDGSATDWPEEVFVQISESQVGRAIRTQKWKYSVRDPRAKGGSVASSDRYVEDFLYDLESDPHERNNLVSDAALSDVRKELAARLKRRMAAAGEEEPEIVSSAEAN